MKIVSIFIAVLLFIPSGAFAQATDVTVQFLYQACKTDMAAGTPRFCLGYIVGVGQMMGDNASALASAKTLDANTQLYFRGTSICSNTASRDLPSGGAMIQAFMNWAEKHPERWSGSASFGVPIALAETWPCP